MMNRKRILRKSVKLAILVGMLVTFTACNSKETVLLEEDLVQIGSLEENSQSAQATIQPTEENSQSAQATTQPTEENSQSTQEPLKEQVEQSTLFVHICGEVMEPGVYELPSGSRIYEAVEEAGGFTQEASESYVNLAQVLQDGWKIEIPAVGEEPSADAAGETGISGENVTSGAANTTESAETLVDINTATKAELCSLPGIGETRADSIISYREKQGAFTKIEDIMKVEGIKEGMFQKMKDKICVRGVK